MSQAGSSQDHLSGSAAPQDFEARHTRLRSEMVEVELCLRNTKGEVRKLEAQEYRDRQSLMEMREHARIADRVLERANDALVVTTEYIINQDVGI